MEKVVGVVLLVLVQLAAVSLRGEAADARKNLRQRVELYVLVLSPRPNTQFPGVVWPGGPSLFPAAQLAADMLNNRTDILTGYSVQLLDGDSGCSLNNWATITFAREAYRQRRVVGIVGPACSSAATQIGGLCTHPEINLVAITIANGPQLRSNKYSNMFRLISSSTLYGKALFELMKYNNWKSIATIYNIHQWFFRTLHTSFRNAVNVSTEYELFPLPVEHRMFPLHSIHNRVNVIVVFADSKYIRRLLCLALKSKWRLIYPNYQWIFVETHEDILLDGVEFFHDGHNYTCTKSDMSKASNRTLILRFRLQREDKTAQTDTGLTYDEFFDAYESYFSAYLDKEGIARENVPKDSEDWAATYFDSVWAMGLALNSSMVILNEENMSLPDYQYGDPHMTSVIRGQLLKTNFRGLSGDIYFHNETLEVPTIIDIHQLNPLYTGVEFRIGYYHEENLNITDERNASFVIPIQKQLKTVSTLAVAVFFPAALLTLVMTISLHILHLVFYDSKSIKAQSPKFSHFIFSGCYLFIISALLETVRAANWTGFHDVDSHTFMAIMGTLCNAIFWCLTLGTCLIFGTVCALSWRLYRIFKHFSNPGHFISDPCLVLIIVVLVTVNSAVLLAWSTHDPLLPHFSSGNEEVSVGRVFVYGHCDCRYFSNWLLMWIVNEAVILSVVILAVLNRHIPRKEFNNTRAHSLMVYVVSFLNGICVPIYFIQLKSTHINDPYITLEFLTLGCAMLSCVFLFMPPVIPILQRLCTRQTNPSQVRRASTFMCVHFSTCTCL